MVDDDPSTGEALRLLLDTAGYSIDGAANGREALDYLRRKTPALILLDLSMPVMDGATFRQHQLRNASLARIPVILLSAERDAEERARQLGIEDFQRKPISFVRLLAIIKKRLADGTQSRSWTTTRSAALRPEGKGRLP